MSVPQTAILAPEKTLLVLIKVCLKHSKLFLLNDLFIS